MSDERDLHRKDRRSYRIAGLPNRSFSSTADAIGHVDDLVPGYALGALEPDEVAAVDAHIRGCPSCELSLADALRTTGMLPFMLPMQKPPIDSKVALFARVAHAQKAAASSSLPLMGIDAWRSPTIPSSTGLGVASAGSADSTPTAAGATSSARASRSGWLVSALSVPLLIALVATGFWGVQLQNKLASQNSELADLQSELANFGSGTTSYPLSPGYDAPQAEGQIVMGSDGRAGMLQIDVNSKDRAGAYELWVNQDGKLVPAAEFTVDQDGQGQARFQLDQPFSEYESVHIRAKAVDAAVADSQFDTLVRDSGGALGSTGSGLDIGP